MWGTGHSLHDIFFISSEEKSKKFLETIKQILLKKHEKIIVNMIDSVF